VAQFGVPALDRALGEIPKGGFVLVRHEPTVDATPFALQAAAARQHAGKHAVYLTANRPPSRVREALMDLDPKASAPVLIDAHSALLGASDESEYRIANPADPLQVAAALEKAAREHPDALLVIDSLSGLLDHSEQGPFVAALPRLLAAARRFRFCIALWTTWPYPEEVEKALGGADAVVGLRGVEERVVLHQTLAVEKSRWGHPAPPMLYRVDRPGGVLLYVPKVIVVGPESAGKTTFVQAVSESSQSVDRMGTTVALDRGTALLDGVKVEVFGTPGAQRFDPLLPSLTGQAVAAILVVDATKPESFPRARGLLDKCGGTG
jgi:uncharacterized protein